MSNYICICLAKTLKEIRKWYGFIETVPVSFLPWTTICSDILTPLIPIWSHAPLILFFIFFHCRHSTMVVGKTGAGKSVVWKTLQATLSAMRKKNEPGYNNVRVRECLFHGRLIFNERVSLSPLIPGAPSLSHIHITLMFRNTRLTQKLFLWASCMASLI